MDMCSWHKVERYKKSMKLRVSREGRNKEDMGNVSYGWVGMPETRKIWETLLTGGYAGNKENMGNLYYGWVGMLERWKI